MTVIHGGLVLQRAFAVHSDFPFGTSDEKGVILGANSEPQSPYYGVWRLTLGDPWAAYYHSYEDAYADGVEHGWIAGSLPQPPAPPAPAPPTPAPAPPTPAPPGNPLPPTPPLPPEVELVDYRDWWESCRGPAPADVTFPAVTVPRGTPCSQAQPSAGGASGSRPGTPATPSTGGSAAQTGAAAGGIVDQVTGALTKELTVAGVRIPYWALGLAGYVYLNRKNKRGLF